MRVHCIIIIPECYLLILESSHAIPEGAGGFWDYHIIPRMMKVEIMPKVKMLRAV